MATAWPWLVGGLVLLLAGSALWLVLRRAPVPAAEDLYAKALEHWVAGDRIAARDLLRQVVARHPDAVEPYLHLGVLLRETGDPGRATALHRSLAVRADLDPSRKLTVGLELADDLAALERWREARDVLDDLAAAGVGSRRYYLTRFRAMNGLGDHAAAARALREGERRVRESDRAFFRGARAAYLLDLALQAAAEGLDDRARALLREAEGLPEARGRTHLIRAQLAAQALDPEAAVTAASEGLREHPEEMAPFLPALEEILFATGRFQKAIPMLEGAVRTQEAPPALAVALAMLYEKIGKRPDALRLLEGLRGDPRLTPDTAAPYLRLLAAESPHEDFSRLWDLLSMPPGIQDWVCQRCHHAEVGIRWFCPSCHGFDTYEARRVTPTRKALAPADVPRLTEPPRA